MPLGGYQRKWRQQPQHAAKLNADHPLASAVVGLWIGSQPTALGDSAITGSGFTRTLVAPNSGVSFGSYAGTGIINLPNNDKFRLVGKNATVIAGATIGTLVTSEFPHIFAVRDEATNRLSITFGTGGANWSGGRFGVSVAGLESIGTSGSAKQGATAIYGAQWGTNGRRLYVDGAFNASSADTSTITTAAIQPSIGNRQSGGRAMSGSLHFVYLFDQNIDDYWHAEIARNPWQLFAPKRIWVPMSAGGGGATYDVALTEATSAADLFGAAGAFGASGAESISAADQLTTGAAPYSADATESITASDAISAIGVLGRSLTEAVSLADLATAVMALQAAVAEAATAAEQQATGPVVTGTMAESIAASEALTATASLLATVANAAAASDAYSTAAARVASISEAASASDAVGGGAAAMYSVSLTELATALDALIGVLAAVVPDWPLLPRRGRSTNTAGGERPAQISTGTRSNLQ